MPCFVMGMELVGKSKRTFAGILCWFFETSGYFLALILAYIVNDNWRLLQTLYSGKYYTREGTHSFKTALQTRRKTDK